MPNSRLAQFIVPAAMIDDTSDMVRGLLLPFIVMEARQAIDRGVITGVHYTVWHPMLPLMPLMQAGPGHELRAAIPWLEPTVYSLGGEAFEVVFRPLSVITGRTALRHGFRLVNDPAGNRFVVPVSLAAQDPGAAPDEVAAEPENGAGQDRAEPGQSRADPDATAGYARTRH